MVYVIVIGFLLMLAALLCADLFSPGKTAMACQRFWEPQRANGTLNVMDPMSTKPTSWLTPRGVITPMAASA